MSSGQGVHHGDKPKVTASLEDADGFRCVDILEQADGAFTFKEFRRDPEDGGRWTLIGDYSRRSYPTKLDAINAAAETLAWFAAVVR